MEKNYFKSFDEKEIPYLFFKSSRKDTNNNVIIFHGMVEPMYRYEEFGNFLSVNGYNVYVMELRGHGELKEGVYGDFGEKGITGIFDDIKIFFETLVSEKGINRNNTVIFGHSMGSLIATRLMIEMKFKNLIISGFTIYKKATVFTGKILTYLERMLIFKKKSTFNGKFKKYNMSFSPIYTKYDWLTRDINEARKYSEDVNCGYAVTPKFFTGIFQMMSYINRNYKKIEKDARILTVYGTEDKSMDIGHVNNILSKLRKKKRRINVVANENGRHESLNEINKYIIYDEILKWMNEIMK